MPPEAVRRAGRYRVAFLVQQVLGHVTHSASLRRAVEADPDLDATWVPVTYVRDGGLIERLPLPAGARGTLRGASDVLRTLSGRRYDAIFFNCTPLAAMAAHRVPRTPTVVSLDVTPRQYDREAAHFGHRADGTGPLARAKDALNRRTLRSCAALLPWSTWARDSLVEEYGVPASRVEVIPPGVDLAAWRRPDRPANPVPRVLFVGGGFARKGGDLLLRWFAERGRGRCELHLVTGDAAAEGPHPLGVHVHRGLGPNDEALRRLFWSSDVFALPSRSEPFGIVCAEAMAAGLPVVASAVGGITDIVEDGVSGRLVPADDPGALGAALDELLGSEPRRRALGDAGRRIAERRFDERVNGSRTLEIVKRSAERVRGAVGDVAGAP